MFRCTLWRIIFSPNNSCNEITRSKDFICNLFQIVLLIIINGNKYGPIIRQQISRQHQPRVHHAAPVGVEPGVALGVLHELLVALLVKQADLLVVLLLVHLKAVVVDEVVAGVVGRVDVDHLHLTQVALLEELQHLQVVPLDVQVFGGVPVLALLWAGAQGLADGLIGLHDGGLLAHPGELVGLVPLQHVIGQHLPEQFKIDGLFQPALAVRPLRDTPGEQCGDLLYIPASQISCGPSGGASTLISIFKGCTDCVKFLWIIL